MTLAVTRSDPPAGYVRHYSRVCPGLWIDVPEQQPGSSGHIALKRWRAACRAQPGEWCRYPGSVPRLTSAQTVVAQINLGRTPVWRPSGSWQAEVRDADSTPSVWVRYLGTGEPPEVGAP